MNNILSLSLEQIAKISILLNPIIPTASTKVLDALNLKNQSRNLSFLDGKEIFEKDLLALVGERNASYNEHIKFVSLSVNARSLEKHKAKLRIMIEDENKHIDSIGNGPVDATFHAIKNLTKTNFKLKLYQVHAITAGTDAQGEVTVRLEDEQLSSQAKGSDPDIIVASAKAYINALNRLIFKKSKSINQELSDLKIEGI